MARKRRGRRGPLRGVGRWVNVGFKLLGAVVVASPAITPVQAAISKGNANTLGEDLAFSYIGLTNTGGIATSQATKGLGTVAIGVVLMKLGGWLGKQMR